MITTDTFLGNGDYSKTSNFSFPLAYIGTDNVLGGYEVGKRLAELIGNTGKVYMNTTNPDASSVTGRRDGFLKAMKEFPDIEVVGIDYNLDVQETAQRQTAAVLQAHPDLKGIFGTNLFSAQGAYQAVDNAGRPERSRSPLGRHAGPDPSPQGRQGRPGPGPEAVPDRATGRSGGTTPQKAGSQEGHPRSSSSPGRTWTPWAASDISTSKLAQKAYAQAA
jgi:hypothetical protein